MFGTLLGKSTLFSKIVTIFIVILLVSTSITAGMLYFFLWNFLSREKEHTLNEASQYINRGLETYVRNSDNIIIREILEGNLTSYINFLSTNTNSVIWVVLPDGEIWLKADANGSMSRTESRKLDNGLGNGKLKDDKQFKDVMSGQKEYIKEIGNFYGLFEESYWLTIQRPFVYKGEVLGAVYLHTRIPEISRAINNIFRFFFLSVAAAIVVSIALVYVFSLRLSKPLKEINNAAKRIADGEFDKRLDIRSEDEIGELATSFNNMASALQNLEEMRKGFIANVSHELRTPMTSIHGFIEGILDGTIPEKRQKEYLTIVRDETKRLNRLTTDLLDLAKMESGEIRLRPINFNINELIRRCIIKLENLIIQKDIHIEANFEEDEIYVNGDVDSIERVIINLVHNAVKFVRQNGRIILGTSTYRNKVLVFVEDNGIGIDNSEINMVWDRFYKSDKSRSADKTGTGLGLAIVKNIINEHKQEIWVTSEVGVGTKFSFTLSRAHDNIDRI
ncbi:MAG: cell wall metabolism sensor histidine kinase WalK [Clostridiaceae bacterium]|nr:cell wall metabolism sensor histidine kinase WalK [Clostridiaceae bacterium]